MEISPVLVLLQVIFIIIGILFLRGGIRIIKDKEYLFVEKPHFSRPWRPPFLFAGKKALPHGFLYMITGIAFIVVALLLCFA